MISRKLLILGFVATGLEAVSTIGCGGGGKLNFGCTDEASVFHGLAMVRTLMGI
jgi:hypothetical protein